MNHFHYINGILHAEDVSIPQIAKEVGTPFYCYSTATLTRHYNVFAEAFSDIDAKICYAMKANSNQAVLTTLAKLGCGADVVSAGELNRALAAGMPAEKIMFSGVGKTKAEMMAALEAGIFCFNVESVPELHQLSAVATEMGKTAPVSLRINPDVDAETHAKISTGKAGDKFGIPREDAIEVQGHEIDHVDVGGGLGIPYKNDNSPPPEPEAYAQIVKKHVKELDCEVAFEPGRMIAGNAGILVGEVIYIKPSGEKTFIIANTAMNDLIRPTLYDAWHEIRPVEEAILSQPPLKGDLVGPVCETGDFIAKDRNLPALKAGDLFAVGSAGAYGAVQAGTYNTRALVPEVLVNGDTFHVIRPRQTVEDLIAMDSLPDWL